MGENYGDAAMTVDVTWMEHVLPGIEAMAAGELPIPETWPEPNSPEIPESSPCVHRWRIDEANGPTSPGHCKRCGAEREFYNADPAGTRKATPVTLKRSAHVAGTKPKAWSKR